MTHGTRLVNLSAKPSHSVYFMIGLMLLCLIYLVAEYFLNGYATLSVDEFWFAHLAYQYKDHLPYRDLAPYKTVLGYYLLLLPISFSSSSGLISSLIFTKNAIALLNACLLFASCLWLTRFFSRKGILTSLTFLLASDVVLTYSTNIRVDLFAYWFGFFSCLCLMEALSKQTLRYYVAAGILMGFGFATSQKILWYILASNVALGVVWLFVGNRGRSFVAKNAPQDDNLQASPQDDNLQASPQDDNLQASPHDDNLQASPHDDNLQVPSRDNSIAANNQILLGTTIFNLTLLGMVLLYLAFWSWLTDWHTVWQSVFQEAVIMYRLDWYGPTRKLFWSYTLSFNALLFLLCPFTLLGLYFTYPGDHSRLYRFFVTCYALTLLFCLIPYKQVFPYYMQVLIPAFLILYAAFFTWLWDALKTSSAQTALVTSILVASGVIYPLTLFGKKLLHFNSSYQKANLVLLNQLLQDGGDYVAGMDLIYTQNQPIPGMQHLMGPTVDYLYYPSQKLKPVMLASLEQTPNATEASVIEALDHSAVKYYINNYRMQALPPHIKAYLNNQFEHLWGSIYIYAPRVPRGKHTVHIRFGGQYQVESADPRQNHLVSLSKGTYHFTTKVPYRLRLMVNMPVGTLNKDFYDDQWIHVVS